MTAALAIKQPKLLVPEFTPEHVLTIDFETYWAQDYSLTALGTSDYVMDPRFEIIGVGVGDGETRVWMERAAFESFAREVPWHLTAVKCHHAHFDGLILSHHLGIHPAFFFCTLSMSRTFGLQDRGLDDLGVHFKVGRKGSGLYDAKEKRRRDFTPEEWAAYGEYCLNDLALTDDIFDAMAKADEGYPESELWVINEHVKMFTEPRIFLDTPLLVEFLKDERIRKKALLDRVAKDRKIITSDKLFINELYLAGLDVIPMKPSPKRKVKKEVVVNEEVNGLIVPTKRMVDTDEPLMIPAFSKNDPGMQELVEHEIEMVRWLAETRLAIKSTINETRTERFLKSAGVQVLPDGRAHQFAPPRPVCVYLNYYGGHTGRASGSDKRNWQNLERTNKKNPKKGILRKSALAPAGRKFAAADSGAIEARVNAWLSGHDQLVEAFAQGRDVYSEFMSEVLGRHVDRKKNPEDEIPGFIGKICILGLGYQMGWPKLAENFLKGAMNGPPVKFGWEMAEQLSVDVSKFISDDWKMDKVGKMITRVTKEELTVHCAVTEAIVKKWRNLNQPIVRLWETMENVIEAMCEDDADYTFGPNECLRVVRHAIVLPNGMRLRYPGLRYVDGFSYLGQYGKMRVSLYGGKLTENVVQALARIIVTDQMLDVKARTGEDPALFTHDDLAYLPLDERAAWFNMVLQQTMKTTPDWAEGLPLSVEGGVDQSYGKCK